MSNAPSTTSGSSSVYTGLPSGIVPYIAIVAALVSAGIHLKLAPVVLAFDKMQAVLFVLAGLGFICGIVVYLTRYWQRTFYLVAILFALAQIIAFFVMGGPTNTMAITSKTAEAVFVITAAYLYVNDQPAATPQVGS